MLGVRGGDLRGDGQAHHLLPLSLTRGLQLPSSTCSSPAKPGPPTPQTPDSERPWVGRLCPQSQGAGRCVDLSRVSACPALKGSLGTLSPGPTQPPGAGRSTGRRVLLCPGAAVGRAQGGSGPARRAAHPLTVLGPAALSPSPCLSLASGPRGKATAPWASHPRSQRVAALLWMPRDTHPGG